MSEHQPMTQVSMDQSQQQPKNLVSKGSTGGSNWRAVSEILAASDTLDGKNQPSCYGLWTLLDSIGLAIALLVQGSILNYFLIYYNDGSSGWYFLFLVDFLILIMFSFSITFAWRYYQRNSRSPIVSSTAGSGAESTEPRNRFGAGIFQFSFPKPLGMLPLIYICWIFYSLALVFKLFTIYFMDIPEEMVQDETPLPKERLQLTLASAVVVFVLWVEAHRSLESDRQRILSKPSYDDLIGHIVFEIFDSVTFLDLVTPDDKNELMEDQKNISLEMKYTVLFLSSVNFLLPTLGLYRMSRTHFGEKTNGMLKVVNEVTGKPSTRGIGISIIYQLMKLCLINIPYLVIRIHLSRDPGKELTIFVVKNVLGIWVSVRNLIPEFREYMRINRLKKLLETRHTVMTLGPNGTPRPVVKIDSFDPSRGWELPGMLEGIERIQRKRASSASSQDQSGPSPEGIHLSTESTDTTDSRDGARY